MSQWIVLGAALVAALGLGLILAVHIRRRRRLELRLLAGREKLLGEEIARRLQALRALDTGQAQAQREAALAGVDALHAALTERQAHLLEWEEMVALQDQRLSTAAQEAPVGASRRTRPGGAGELPPQEPPSESRPPRTRQHLEGELLERIGQLQAEPPPPRKRRPPRP
ncbi:MAG: hypothetical protein AB1505_00935 [Candidatus Latescibacterota bacterium]